MKETNISLKDVLTLVKNHWNNLNAHEQEIIVELLAGKK